MVATASALSGSGSLDDVVYNIPNGSFPFSFVYDGNSYTGCNISSNGFITFGATAPGTTDYNPISSTTGFLGAISAFGGDLNAVYNLGTPVSTGEIRVEVVGVAPNREIVIQYSNFRPSYTSSSSDAYVFNFQIRLAETTNIISVVYGPGQYVIGSLGYSGTRQIGLRGATNASYNNRNSGSGVLFSASTAGGSNSATQSYNTTAATPGMPGNGLTYQWSPPPVCSGAPASNTAVASNTNVSCPGLTSNLSLAASYTVSGLTYQWQVATAGVSGPYSAVANATTAAYTATLGGQSWYQCVITCTSGPSSTTSTPVQINIAGPSVANSVASPSVLCGTNSSNLSLSSSYSGVTYQWQSATTASTGPYSAISNATLSTLTATSIPVTSWFQAVVSCSANTSFSVLTNPAQILVPPSTTSTVPYFESFETITLTNELPNCSWVASNLPTICRTYTAPTGSYNQMANTGNNYASFRYGTNTNGDYFYSNGIQLTAGSTYSASMKYITDGLSGWTQVALLYGTSQSSTALTQVASVSNPVNTAYTGLGGIFTAPSTGTYYLAVKVIGTFNPWYLSWDDLSLVQLVGCIGTPGANTVVATTSVACPNSAVGLSLANTYTTGGYTYQWSVATASTGPYTSIPSGTLATYTETNIATAGWYQCVITCTNGPASTTATPVQVLVSGNPCSCLAYCTSSATSNFDEEIFNVSIGTLNNTSSCGTTGGVGSTLNQYSNYTGIVAAPNLVAGSSYAFSVTVGECNGNSYSGGVVAYIDFNQNGVFTDPGEQIYVSPSTLFAVAGTVLGGNVTIPVGATPGITRMRVIAVEGVTGQSSCGTFSWGETEDYCVNIQPAPSCSGAPAANSVVATLTSVCSAASTTLNLASTYTIGGLTYQWSSATSSVGPYTSISGATLTSLTATNITSATWYQCVITCSNGPVSTTATPLQITINTDPCNCAAYCTSSATSTGDEEIFNVSIGSLNNTSNCTQTGGPGSVLNMYSNYTGIVAPPTLVAGAVYPFSVTVGECSGNSYSGGAVAYIDFNQNGLFTDPGEQVYVSANTSFAVAGTVLSANITVPVTASVGITRMRVIAVEGSVGQAPCTNYTWGETEDYCVDIAAPVGCTGAPASNSAVATITSVCPNGTATVNLASTYTIGGLTYQWSVSTSSAGTYTALAGETLPSLTATNVTTSLWYQCVITCTNGPASTTSTPVQIVVNNNPCQCASYCTTSQASSTADDEIFNVSIGTLNNTSNCSQTGGPGSILNRYSNYTGLVAAPSLSTGSTYAFSVTVGQCGAGAYSGGVVIYMDFNQNGVFTDAGEQVFVSPSTLFAITGTTLTGNVMVPPTASIGITRMRVIAVESTTNAGSCAGYTWGETEDYCIDIVPAPPCTSASGGTISPVSYGACTGATVALNSTGYSLGTGTNYQWMVSNTPGGPYAPVTGGTGSTSISYTTAALTPTVYYYVLQTTCTSASLTGVSNEATVTINAIPTASISSNAPICSNNNLMLTGGTDFGTTFSWFGPNSFTSNVQNPTITNAPGAANGNYTLVVSVSGCSATPVVQNITVNSTSLTIVASPPAICLGNSTTLTAVGNATTLTWSTGSTSTSIVVNPTLNTTYSITGVGASACPAYDSVAIAVTNPTIVGTGAAVCTPSTVVTLSATAFGPVSWYSSPSSTTAIATGNTYTTTAATTTTYYAQAVSTTTTNLFVSLAGGNGSNGNMFDIVASSNIEVNGFNIHTQSTSVYTIEVWTRAGSFVGFNTSNTGWTMVGTTTVTGLGTGVVTPVPISFTVPVSAGQTQAFYVTSTSGSGIFNYTNGTSVGALWVSNSDLQVLQGNGGGYFSVTFSPRCFNGEVLYTKTGCTSPLIPVVVTVGGQPTVAAVAGSGTVCAGGSTGLTASGASTYSWSTGSTNTIIAVTPSVTTTYSVIGDYSTACNDTAFVTVVVNPLPSVSLTASQTTVCVNGPTVGLTGSPVGGNYTGPNVSSGGVFTPGSSQGTFAAGYTFVDPTTSCSNTSTLSIVVSLCTGIDKTSPLNGLSVYPNPNYGEFTIELNNGLTKDIEITDLTGRVMFTTSTPESKMKLNISEFANGVYFVKIKSDKSVEVVKIVKQ